MKGGDTHATVRELCDSISKKQKDVKAVCCESKNFFKNGSEEQAVNIMLKLTERSERVGQH
ncbi:hypothetical protein ACT7DP_03030 [Bacillus paranthracis]